MTRKVVRKDKYGSSAVMLFVFFYLLCEAFIIPFDIRDLLDYVFDLISFNSETSVSSGESLTDSSSTTDGVLPGR